MNIETILITFVASAPGLLGAFFAYRVATGQRRSAEQVETRKVDAEAYDRAENIYKGSIEQLEANQARLQREFQAQEERHQRTQHATDARHQRELGRLRRRIEILEDLVKDLGGTVPSGELEGRS